MLGEQDEYKEEDIMADYLHIFMAYKDERDKREAAEKELYSLRLALRDENEALKKEISALRQGKGAETENGMTDLQFLSYKELRDKLEEALREQVSLLQNKCDALEKKNAALRDS